MIDGADLADPPPFQLVPVTLVMDLVTSIVALDLVHVLSWFGHSAGPSASSATATGAMMTTLYSSKPGPPGGGPPLNIDYIFLQKNEKRFFCQKVPHRHKWVQAVLHAVLQAPASHPQEHHLWKRIGSATDSQRRRR